MLCKLRILENWDRYSRLQRRSKRGRRWFTPPLLHRRRPLVLREISAMRRLSDHPQHPQVPRGHGHPLQALPDHGACPRQRALLAPRPPRPPPASCRYFKQLIPQLLPRPWILLPRREAREASPRQPRQPQALRFQPLRPLGPLRLDVLLYTACGTLAYTTPEVICRKGVTTGPRRRVVLQCYPLRTLHRLPPLRRLKHVAMCKRIPRREYQFPSWFSPSVK